MRFVLLSLALCIPAVIAAADEVKPAMALQVETDHLRYAVSADGHNVQFVDKATKTDYCVPTPFAVLRKAGKECPATSVAADPAMIKPGQASRVEVQFGAAKATAILRVSAFPGYFSIEVASVSDTDIETLAFANLQFKLKGTLEEPFAAAGMALNLKTNVPGFPMPCAGTSANCYPRFGLTGAKIAIVGSAPAKMRKIMQEVILAAPDLPHSTVGGAWAQDAPIAHGSYLFNFGGMTEQNVDTWVQVTKSIGFNQIDFHGGDSFRFGDFRPNPVTYPKGYASLKAVIDKLHAGGIKAGLHTYAFFIDKRTPYVTPIPDPRLAKDASFTLADALPEAGNAVPVTESTAKMSATTGFFVRNSATVQIDNELITYTGISQQPPFTFTGCARGACGTKVAAHAKGAKVHHLKECFGLFVPDPETDMLAEVAAKTAEIYNKCGFDMMYLDALDGEDILGGWQDSWHYGSQFVFEICKRINKPALMEMSTFHHHLWYVRSRGGALDHPTRSHKRFIDMHCRGNAEYARMFLSANLGWWALKTWTGPAGEPTFSDDIEYLCCKALATDTGLSLMGIDPGNFDKLGAAKQLAPIFKRYEDLRHSGAVPESIRKRIGVLGDEFTLQVDPKGKFEFRPVQYARHKVEGLDGSSSKWPVENRFAAQPVQLRIQGLMSAGAYDAPGNPTVLDFPADTLPNRAVAAGVSASLTASTDQVKAGAASAKLTAKNTGANRFGAWATFGKTCAPLLNIGTHQALGVWVYGDGKGEILNVQLKSPAHLTGMADHYVVVDFTGWRYFELIEPEGEHHALYGWPYGDAYSIYREYVYMTAIEEVSLWLGNLPPGQEVTCYVSPIRGLPLADTKLKNPAVTIAGRTLTFACEIGSGSYLEFHSPTDCKLFDPQGNLVSDVKPTGDVPELPAGPGEVTFTCAPPAALSARANVWVSGQGDPLK